MIKGYSNAIAWTSLNRRYVYTILATWIVMQVLMFMRFGIFTDGESWKYIYEAEWLLEHGELTSNNFYFYFVNILTIALSLKLKTGYILPVAIQLILNLFSTMVFFRWTASVFTPRTSWLATIALVLFSPYQQFNFFLQTESVFYSLIIIYSFYLCTSERLSPARICMILFLSVLLVFTRPTGILFTIPTWILIYQKFISGKKPAVRMIFLAIPFAAFFPAVNSIMRSGGELNFMLPLVEQHIICGVRTTAPTLLENNPELNSIPGIIKFIAAEPGIFIKLGLKRSAAFFGLYRNYFSVMHNIMTMAVFFLLYALIVQSLQFWRKNQKTLRSFLFLSIAVTWITAVLTCDDWHNRFVFSIYPFLIILSLPAVERFLGKFQERNSGKYTNN